MVKKINTLNVFMNGEHVGVLSRLGAHSLTFDYDGGWLGRDSARPISLSLPLTKKHHQGEQVYNFFDNLLPENEEIRKRIQVKLRINSSQPFDLLAGIGHDCVGAIQLLEEKHISDIKKITGKPLNEHEMAYKLANCKEEPLGMEADVKDFRISIAGVQEKVCLLQQNKQWFLPQDATPTTHILKPPIGKTRYENQNIDLTDSCENEWLCGKIAAAFGLPVAEMEIVYFDDVKALSVTRFDRKLSGDGSWIIRLPQEDMCQALGYSPALKYQSDGGPGVKDVMDLLLGAEKANIEREKFFRSQILFWMLAGIDGHAKNFSLFLESEGRFKLTPLYDIISAYPLMANSSLAKQKVRMAMALKGKDTHYDWYRIQKRHFISTAKWANYSVPDAERILEEMLSQVDEVIGQVSEQLDSSFPHTVSEPIFEGMRRFLT